MSDWVLHLLWRISHSVPGGLTYFLWSKKVDLSTFFSLFLEEEWVQKCVSSMASLSCSCFQGETHYEHGPGLKPTIEYKLEDSQTHGNIHRVTSITSKHTHILQSFPWTFSHECVVEAKHQRAHLISSECCLVIQSSGRRERGRGREREHFHMMGAWIMVNMISRLPFNSWVWIPVFQKSH